MNTDKQSEGTVESEQSTQSETVVAQSPLLSAVLEEMGVKGTNQQTEAQTKPVEEQPAPVEEQPTQTEPTTPVEEQPPAEPETVETTEPAKAEEVHEKEDKPPREEWPPDAKARVAEEASKRRKRTAELEKKTAELDQAKAAAAYWHGQAQAIFRKAQERPVQTTENDPLADVQDGPSLQQAVSHYEELAEFARLNSDGVEDIVIGKDANGDPITRTYTKEQIARMGLDAEKVLRKYVPMKVAALQQQAIMTEQARKERPEIFTDPEVGKAVQTLLSIIPEIRRAPDYLISIGDMIEGMNARLARQRNGSTSTVSGQQTTKAAKAILSQPKFTAAPAIPKTRSPVTEPTTGQNVDVESAKARMKNAKTAEEKDAAVTDFIAATLQQKAQPAPALA